MIRIRPRVVWPKSCLLASFLFVAQTFIPGASDVAFADEPAFTIEARPVWFVMGGVTGGYTVALTERAGFVGGELSLVRIRGNGFSGLYADGYYEFGGDAVHVTLGPEFGLIRRSPSLPIAFGIDGGLALRFADGTEIGGAGRVFLNFNGVFSLYGRYLHFGSDDGDRAIQVGAMLKFPLASPFGPATR